MTHPPYQIDCVAFAPHPDDAEMWCGGTLRLLHELGYSCGIVDLTQGELSTLGSLAARERETKDASAILGLSLRENLQLPDGGLNSRNDDQIRSLVRALRKLRPEFVFVPFWEDRHPDHKEASALLDRAIFLSGLSKYDVADSSGERYSPRQIIYYPMRYISHPSFVIDVSSAHACKMHAVRAYKTQFGLEQDQSGNTSSSALSTLLSSPLSLSSLEARDQFYGAMIGVSYGEPFIVRNALRIQNPIEHFRECSGEQALFFPFGGTSIL